jgi:hypothetical protein
MRKSKTNFIVDTRVYEPFCEDDIDWDFYKVKKPEHIMRILKEKGIEFKLPEGVEIPLSERSYQLRVTMPSREVRIPCPNRYANLSIVVNNFADIDEEPTWYLCIRKYKSSANVPLAKYIIADEKAGKLTLSEREGLLSLDEKYLTEEARILKDLVFRHTYDRQHNWKHKLILKKDTIIFINELKQQENDKINTTTTDKYN